MKPLTERYQAGLLGVLSSHDERLSQAPSYP